MSQEQSIRFPMRVMLKTIAAIDYILSTLGPSDLLLNEKRGLIDPFTSYEPSSKIFSL